MRTVVLVHTVRMIICSAARISKRTFAASTSAQAAAATGSTGGRAGKSPGDAGRSGVAEAEHAAVGGPAPPAAAARFMAASAALNVGARFRFAERPA